MTLQPLHGHCIYIQGHVRGLCNTEATLHPAEVALQAHCHHCRITAFTFSGTAYYNTSQCLHIVGHCIQSLDTASKFRDNAGALQPLQGHCILMKWHCRGSATTAGSLHHPSWAVNPASQHTASTLCHTADTAWALHPHSEAWQGALQPLQLHCIQLKWHSRRTAITEDSLHPLHGHCINIPGECHWHCRHCRNTASTFMGTASSITTYCMHLVGHCLQCLGTASTFSDNAVRTSTTTGILHTVEVTLQAHCIQHRLTAYTSVGTASSITTYCILCHNILQPFVGHFNYCMDMASTFREL